MASSEFYLDQFLKGVNSLPNELTGTLEQMTLLDGSIELEKQQAERIVTQFEMMSDRLTKNEKNDREKIIFEKMEKAAGNQDQKIEMAETINQKINEQIAQLDCFLAQYENELSVMDALEIGGSRRSQLTSNQKVTDMPVDPNEPTYCFCNRVAFGDMVGCDNPNCLIDWFHFDCVGLKRKPVGDWFCETCKCERKKKIKNKF
ncbi:unnamed protein product [Oikopleura dioica]|uniref:Inhibitor of growth protein n=1 Tax=Oikopleura dioica TaxID=34765 RepID=E4XEC6_OIKDI|nr:unnamed protein product [Oikopleura dioica]